MMKIRSRFAAAILSIGLLYLNIGSGANAGTLLPNGEQMFTDNNGLPLAAGCVYFYVPGTNTPKATYQNAAQTIANTNPVQLDATGRAIIYGTGTYRQVVNAAGTNVSTPCSPPGTQIWDQITADTSSTVTIYAGASSGTPNAITVNAPAFSGTDGQVINYISTNTNSGGATLNPSGFGAVQIMRDSATGPGALTGGELVATNAVSVIYDATAGVFHILSPVNWPNTSGVPVGTIISVGGFTAPTNYAFAYGQAVSRTSFSSLFNAYTSQQTASLSSGSPTITGLSDTTQFARGQAIEAIGIPSSTTIQSCTNTTCTLSQNATATRSGTVTVFPYGDGDGSTTFNLPDLRGKILVGRDNMNGAPANVTQVFTGLTTTSGSNAGTVSSATNLVVGMWITGNPNIAPGTAISSISGLNVTLSANATGTASGIGTRFSVYPDAQGLGISGGSDVHSLTLAEAPTGITASGTNGITVNPPAGQSVAAVPSGNSINSVQVANLGSGSFWAPYIGATGWGAQNSFSGNNTINVTANNTGGLPHPIVPPSIIMNWAVRLTP